MEYIIIAVASVLFSLLYFRIARHYHIIDKPNVRSAHAEVTIRGGGVVYPFVFLMYLGSRYFFTELNSVDYTLFGLGLLLVCTVSFVDDIRELSSKIRLIFQFMAVLFLFYYIGASAATAAFLMPIAVVVTIGILNAFNFMDGINGMSGLYSVVTLATLYIINQYVVSFTDPDFIVYPAIASLVFLFFNFRKKAVCFMGDVGSMGIAFWIAALIGKLMIETGEMKWILLLTVYGVETVLTIVERIRLKENIFKAHRRHLYQLLANDKKMPHVQVSTAYALAQTVLSMVVVLSDIPDWIIIPVTITVCASFYLFLKHRIKIQIAGLK